MQRFLFRLVAIPYARVLRSQLRYGEALRFLSAIYSLPLGSGSGNAPIPVNALIADIQHRVGDLSSSVEAARIVLRQTESKDTLMRDGLSADTGEYIRFWMKWLLASATKFLDSEAHALAREVRTKSTDLRPQRVAAGVRKLFPISVAQGLAFDDAFSAEESNT